MKFCKAMSWLFTKDNSSALEGLHSAINFQLHDVHNESYSKKKRAKEIANILQYAEGFTYGIAKK